MTQTPKKSSGFSLLELMVTIVIVAIITTIALSSYQNSVMTSRRTTAQADLTALIDWAQRHYIETNKYPTTDDLPFEQSPRSGTAYYTLSASSDSHKIQAAPAAGSSQVSDRCGTLTMTSAGEKGAATGTGTGTTAVAVTDCWP